jgi:Flp pilus assembly protein TadD
MTPNKEYSYHIIFVNIAIFTLALLSVIFSFNPEWGFWGIDTPRSYPVWIRLALLLLLSLSIIPLISSKLSKIIFYLNQQLKRKQQVISALIISISAAILFILFSSRNFLLGDGYNILGNITNGQSISPTEPLEYLFHQFLYILTGKGNALITYRISSLLAGLAFIFGIVLITRNTRNLLPALAISVNFAAIQFFFGYVENYTYAFVLSFFYINFAYRDLDANKIRVVTLVLIVLAVLFHLTSLILLPSFIYLIYKRYNSMKLILWTSIIIAIGLVVIGVFYLSGKIDFGQIFTPTASTLENPYYLFSAAHSKDLLNIFLLNYIMLPMAISALFKFRDRAIFWMLCIIPALLFVFAFDPKISALRDWDLLCIASAPILACAIFGIIKMKESQSGDNKRYTLILPLFCLAVLHTGGWIYGNTKRDYSYTIMKEYVKNDIHYSSAYYGGYRNKSWAMLAYDEHNDIDEAIRADEIRHKGDPADTLNVCNLAHNYLNRGDTSQAIQLVRDSWPRLVSDDGAATLFGSIMVVTKNYEDAEKIYKAYLATGGKEYSAVYNLGFALDQLGQVDSALMFYDRAFVLWGEAPIVNEIGFYVRAMSLKKYDMAQAGFKRIYSRMPAGYKPSIDLLLNDLAMRNYRAADSLTSAILNVAKSRGSEKSR